MKIKKWFRNFLLIMLLLDIVMLTGECDNDLLFYTSKIFGIMILLINSNILYKYSDVFK